MKFMYAMECEFYLYETYFAHTKYEYKNCISEIYL